MPRLGPALALRGRMVLRVKKSSVTTGNRIFISGTAIMFAIKDHPPPEGLFLGAKQSGVGKCLFPAAVRQRFGLCQKLLMQLPRFFFILHD
jgi:hypothetical protein